MSKLKMAGIQFHCRNPEALQHISTFNFTNLPFPHINFTDTPEMVPSGMGTGHHALGCHAFGGGVNFRFSQSSACQPQPTKVSPSSELTLLSSLGNQQPIPKSDHIPSTMIQTWLRDVWPSSYIVHLMQRHPSAWSLRITCHQVKSHLMYLVTGCYRLRITTVSVYLWVYIPFSSSV